MIHSTIQEINKYSSPINHNSVVPLDVNFRSYNEDFWNILTEFIEFFSPTEKNWRDPFGYKSLRAKCSKFRSIKIHLIFICSYANGDINNF
jgi:hypothetical protein